jgi:hypothetical protein
MKQYDVFRGTHSRADVPGRARRVAVGFHRPEEPTFSRARTCVRRAVPIVGARAPQRSATHHDGSYRRNSNIPAASPAGKWLLEQGRMRKGPSNSVHGAANHEVMTRGVPFKKQSAQQR